MAEKKRKFNDRLEQNAKRERRIIEQSNSEIQKMSTTNLKRAPKKHRKTRMAGNKTNDNQ